MARERLVPLSKRDDPTQMAQHVSVLHEGIPAHLQSSVAEFIRVSLGGDRLALAGLSANKLRGMERELEHPLASGNAVTATKFLLNEIRDDDDLGLDVVDQRLHHLRWPEDEMILTDLLVALHEAGSAWTVQAVVDTDHYQLVRRVDETTQAAAAVAMKHGKAGDHLRRAWAEVYGRKPDPSQGYLEAVKAVEVAAGPVVSPNDKSATLGKMIGELKASPGRFDMVLAGVGDSSAPSRGDLDSVTITRLMAQLLWTSQHDRHGTFDTKELVPVSQAEGEAAIHLAVLLVHWFESGALVARR